MKILIDENLDLEIAEWLRDIGHDVISIAQLSPSISDREILSSAFEENRVVITRDRDYGELIVRHELPARGLLYLRFRSVSKGQMISLFEGWWPVVEGRVTGNIVIVTHDRYRIRPI